MVSGLHAAAVIAGRNLIDEIRGGMVIADPTLLSSWPDNFDSLEATRRLGRKASAVDTQPSVRP
ncbi:hypothetical protein C5E45_25655 [Nocardia nova]|uniref:Uncharacterized protein n=1 Tax=Nocardia nova TaxID=37330 RepID=A0A2S6AJP7_9NOCA|nr:hypothetical protein [Nocardia nova]PPJ25476.1 hypothetical protein C5E41_19705 [Nocardia nova]PPJ35455.1 hypothetical protein C5E45_25655 [Nocardia nova]